MADTPRINGNLVSWADIFCKLDEDRYYGITEVSFDPKRTTTLVYGVGDKPRGRTKGKVEPGDVSMTMDLHAWKALSDKLGSKATNREIGTVPFNGMVQFSYTEDSEIFTYELIGLRVAGAPISASEGSEAITVAVAMSVDEIKLPGDVTL